MAKELAIQKSNAMVLSLTWGQKMNIFPFFKRTSCFLLVAGILVLAVESSMASKLILRPDPSYFSQLSAFEAEWCGPSLCFGSVQFQKEKQVRAVLVKGSSSAVYIEADFRGVKLLKPEFSVIGPVNAKANRKVELGHAVVTFDAQGEVDSLQIRTASLGQLLELRR
jgi:hypothetical protein